ncbi:CCA-adding enzyme [Sporosarcina sp. NCCP-2716]|uniref:CCA tRNA nucleotidyltransferase n=1 Tax=Sporosarcina sp. NCCP-2716 TaxID=2943679 RepID=UPI0020423DE6|nr:CCA tRNA nucleotidyltransferase [Sporosarcina sp. NCCP-2716]GKV67968.1 CCA-adding enzyme [Sporosarcina sp. NCCP-2716]
MFGTAGSRAVAGRLTEAGYETVFVGGAVRDHLLGKQPKDIDIATAATPDQVKSLFQSTVDLGTDHGTVLVIQEGEPIEVTTFRTEGTYSDSRRPDDVQFVTSLDEDLKRRDFTVNALAMTFDGAIVDPFGGQRDLAAKTIRAVGQPEERFGEDALRMLRAVRFVATLGFSIDPATEDAIRKLAPALSRLSVERVKAEFDKLFAGGSAADSLRKMTETGLADVLPLFPELPELLAACAPFRSPSDGWASLMAAGRFTPGDVARAYKLSNRERAYLRSVDSLLEVRKHRGYTVDDFYTASLGPLQTAEKLAAALLQQQPASVCELEAALDALPIRSKHDLAVRGEHVIGWGERRPGKWVGDVLDAIEHAVLHRELPNDYDAIKEWYVHEYERED